MLPFSDSKIRILNRFEAKKGNKSTQQKAQPFSQNSLCAFCCSARQPFCCFTFPTLFSAHSFYFQLIKFSVEKNKNKELKMPLHTDKTAQS